MRARFLLPAVAMLCSACGDVPPASCLDLDPFRGEPNVEASLLTADGAPWTEGGEVSFEMGGQGGFMVQPVIAIDPSSLAPGTLPTPLPERLCTDVEIDNIDPTGGDRFVGFETLNLSVSLRLNAITGRYESTAIFDQLRWSSLPLGTAFGITVVVRAEAFAASSAYEVVLRPE
jgi:hypothetical protein